MMKNKFTVGFIGVGNMGGALAKAVAASGATEKLLFSDKNTELLEKTARTLGGHTADNTMIAKTCDYIFLGVKPSIVPAVLDEIAPTLAARNDFTLISMAAGVKIADICKYGGFPIIRIMPNTPVFVGEGMILYDGNEKASEENINGFISILKKAGRLDRLDEKLIDAAGALTGCGPAFVYMFIEALADGAVECGLPRAKALSYASQTVAGAALNAIASGKHPGELKDAVCSPGGTTIAGVHALESGSFRATSMNAVTEAFKKTAKL